MKFERGSAVRFVLSDVSDGQSLSDVAELVSCGDRFANRCGGMITSRE